MPSGTNPAAERPDVLVLAGGAATRFPGKLQAEFGGRSLLERVLHNLAPAASELVVSAHGDFETGIAIGYGARVIGDRTPGRGPLGGLLAGLPAMRADWVFVVAADLPLVDRALVDRLLAERRQGDEAVIPAHGSRERRRIEPLAAAYERAALLHATRAALDSGRGSLKDALARLRARYLEFDATDETFANVNTAADYAELRRRL